MTHYTVFSLWDTYRALHPFFTITDQQRTNEFVTSLLQMYDDGGRLPMWPLAGNYTDDMLGDGAYLRAEGKKFSLVRGAAWILRQGQEKEKLAVGGEIKV